MKLYVTSSVFSYFSYLSLALLFEVVPTKQEKTTNVKRRTKRKGIDRMLGFDSKKCSIGL